MRHTALAVVRACAAELVEADVLAGDRLDDVGTGDEHVRGLVDHHGEVGDGGGVDRAAGARAHDQRDLRDDAGGQDVAAEDLAVEAEGDHALLDARAARVVDADHRHAGLHREVHDLDDLLAEDLAEAAAEDGEVLGEHADRAAVDRAVAGDDAVAVGAVVGQVEVVGAVPRERVDLDEGALVEQHVDPLARGRLAAGVLLLDRLLAGRVRGRLAARLEVGDLARGGLRVVGRRLVGELWSCGHRTSPLASRRRPVRPSASRYLSHVDHAISGDPGSPSGRETELTTRTRTWDDTALQRALDARRPRRLGARRRDALDRLDQRRRGRAGARGLPGGLHRRRRRAVRRPRPARPRLGVAERRRAGDVGRPAPARPEPDVGLAPAARRRRRGRRAGAPGDARRRSSGPTTSSSTARPTTAAPGRASSAGSSSNASPRPTPSWWASG